MASTSCGYLRGSQILNVSLVLDIKIKILIKICFILPNCLFVILNFGGEIFYVHLAEN